MKTVIIVCAVLAVVAMVLVMACCRVAGESSGRGEEHEKLGQKIDGERKDK